MISGNSFDGAQNGVHMESSNSNGNTITLNSFTNSNHEQIHIHGSNDNNFVFHNNFLDLTGEPFNDECGGCSNVFDENFYKDFVCPDSNSDGFCDNPFFGNGNTDNSPVTTQDGWLNGSPPPPPPPPMPTDTSVITVVTVDEAGDEFTGQWTVFSQNSVTLQTGFSPESFTVNDGEFYEVFVDDFQAIQFSHWENDQTGNPRVFSLTTDETFTASYTTGMDPIPPPPPDNTLEDRVQSLETKEIEQDERIGILEQLYNDIINFFKSLTIIS